MITLRNVSKSYGVVTALQAINLTIPEGMTTALIGPSGCGKSTLLRLIIGLTYPDAGTVYFKDTQVAPDVVLSLRRQMGYVIQEGGLFPHLTARDNVALMARYVGWSESRIEARIDELSDLAQFPRDGLDRYPVQLSGGQRQRVSLMRALMFDPGVLLMDEPLGSLDPLIRSDLQADLKTIFRTLNKTVVLVTHDMGEAAFLGDVIVLLRDGEIVQTGTLDVFFRSPSDPFVTRFVTAQNNSRNALSQNSQ
ncbi:MAG: ATP-binding cassette domain-containing protein [Candidatus Marsarchaeota archaeon]|nr:ATP-binding cassette domain-containing protein [Candidatus Marsarchaeota archaeon]